MPDDESRDITCYNWTVNQRYLHDESQVSVKLDFMPNICSGRHGFSKYTWLSSIIIILALCSFALEVKNIFETVQTTMKLRNAFIKQDEDEQIELFHKAHTMSIDDRDRD